LTAIHDQGRFGANAGMSGRGDQIDEPHERAVEVQQKGSILDVGDAGYLWGMLAARSRTNKRLV
jgi:hypothetical protein